MTLKTSKRICMGLWVFNLAVGHYNVWSGLALDHRKTYMSGLIIMWLCLVGLTIIRYIEIKMEELTKGQL